MMEVEEESTIGTLVGYLTAYDPDIGENALIDYIITGFLLKNNNLKLKIKPFKKLTLSYNLYHIFRRQRWKCL